MKKLFGTDGIRGEANSYPMTIEVCAAFADALMYKYCDFTYMKPMIFIGKDTRISCSIFEHALAAKFCSLGANVKLLGIIPTPILAGYVTKYPAHLGIMISASHNVFSDNGIKIFKGNGRKLTDAEEEEIESLIDGGFKCKNLLGKAVGKSDLDGDGIKIYCEKIRKTFQIERAEAQKVKLVVDAANGSLYKIAPEIFESLGFDAVFINCAPDGTNINDDCGAAHPKAISEAVVKHKADLGIAFDGDGDRVIIADNYGNILDGDYILAILVEAEGLYNEEVVSTIMANFAFERYLESQGIHLVRTNVGDQYISEYMRNSEAKIGGEPSGHIIIKDHLPTGDGLFAALKVLEYSIKSRKSIAELLRIFKPYPSISRSVKVKDKSVIENEIVQIAIEDFQKQLRGEGRLIVRPSGTEPIIRVYAEGNDKLLLEDVVTQLAHLIENM
ncbi:phosphoglucosamine mutase [Alphaproteobacteria bacterium]|nr:phosphoglucosamine mutase [Alphaproteobacteria bacterium]